MKKAKAKEKVKRVGSTQRKIMLLLGTGLMLGLCHSPKQSMRVIRHFGKEWKEIDRKTLNQSIRALYKSKLVETRDNRDGTITLVLSEEGKHLALTYDLDRIAIRKPARWDQKWRVVMFDVPEIKKKLRESLRMHFKEMGFFEFQKSVFVHPYPCREEIEYIIEHYDARRYLRFIVAEHIDNELDLKRYFRI